MAYVYLLHFDAPLERTQHYTGSCEDLARRLDQHSQGSAAQLTRRFHAAGIAFAVGAIWEHATRLEARRAERRVKAAGSARHCCVCRAQRLSDGASAGASSGLDDAG